MELTNKDLEKAIIFATNKHNSQTRKGDGRPYILHPLSVMQHLYRFKKSKNINMLAVVCALHDCLEDCDVTIEEIISEFGIQVASIVMELTSDKEEIKNIGKQEYLANKMLKMSSYALVIKLCDRLDNVNDMNNMSLSFKEKYSSETLYIITRLRERKLSNTHKKLIKEIKKAL